MKKKLSKMVALGLCGLLVLQGSVAPAMAEERVPEETTYEEFVPEPNRRAEWTSVWLDYGPGSLEDYIMVDYGDGTVNTGSLGEDLTALLAGMAMKQAIISISPETALAADAIMGLITLSPQVIVDGFEKYAPLSDDLDYSYKIAINARESTEMYEYYRYDVTYKIGNQPYPVTFYETRTFN